MDQVFHLPGIKFHIGKALNIHKVERLCLQPKLLPTLIVDWAFFHHMQKATGLGFCGCHPGWVSIASENWPTFGLGRFLETERSVRFDGLTADPTLIAKLSRCDLVNNFAIILVKKSFTNQLSFVSFNHNTKYQVLALCKVKSSSIIIWEECGGGESIISKGVEALVEGNQSINICMKTIYINKNINIYMKTIYII